MKWRLGSMKRERPAPQPYEMSWSGHSPPLSQTGQSSGWLTSRNSTIAFCACLTRSERGDHDHAVAHGRGAGGLELRDALDLDQAHAAGADRLAELRLVTEVGDLDVAVLGRVDEHRALGRAHLLAVDLEGDPVGLGPGHARRPPPRAPPARRAERLELARSRAPRLLHVLLELLAEVLEHRGDGHRHRVAEHAQAVADDVPLDLLEDVEVHGRALAVVDPLEHLHGPVGALAAGDALAARLVAVELGQPQRERDQRLRVVDHDHRRPSRASSPPRPSPRRCRAGRGAPCVSTGADEPPGKKHLSSRPSGGPPARP